MSIKCVTFNQALFSMILFNFGSSVIIGINTKVGQDTWISVLLAMLLAVPGLMVYARIIRLFPEKNLYEIIDELLGKIGGKIVAGLLVWYAVHLCALVLRNFSEFIKIAAMPETPQLPIMAMMILIAAYLARGGMPAIGKWSAFVLFPVSFIVLFTVLLAIPQMEISHFFPVFTHEPAAIAESAFQIFSFPFMEPVLFLFLAGAFQKKDNPYKLYFYTLLTTGFLFLLIFARNLCLLGAPMMEIQYFPSYVAARIISIGDFLARVEGSISINFILAGITKITVCLLAASQGLAGLFGAEDHKIFIMPVSMLVLALCAIVYDNTMEMFLFIDYYPFYALPFQVIIPLAIWILGEIHRKMVQ